MDKNGLLLLNKPEGISSFDCIRVLRRVLLPQMQGQKLKIGHAGTLDPAASGLMLMLFGTACRQAQIFSKLDKTYVAEITLGATSTTGDREGEITSSRPGLESGDSANKILRTGLYQCLEEFVGKITQTPSVYSAIKINGQEAYKRARRGEAVEMPSREVTIHSVELINYEYPKLEIKVSCSQWHLHSQLSG